MSGRRRSASAHPNAVLLASAAAGATAVCGIGMLAAALVGLAGDGREVPAFAVAGLAALLLGAGGLWALPQVGTPVHPTAGLGAVTLTWSVAAAVGAIPLLAAGTFDSPLDALFEAMSGFSTTGASLIPRVEAEPDAVLLWRSLTQWLGGVGIIVLIVAIAPTAAPGLLRYFYAEASGTDGGRLTPRIVDTAKIVGGIYVALSLAAGLGFLLAGMGVFDAANHAMTTLATGGFSTRTLSIAAFDSLAIELVAIVFMVAAGVNFALYWRLIKGRPLMPQLAEVRVYLSILAIATAAVTISLLLTDEAAGLDALREASFTVSSLGTTTGFTTADFDVWGGFARSVLILLMIAGGCAGSTAGGMKTIRVSLLARSAAQEIQRQTEPRRVTVLRMGGKVFSEAARSAVFGFFVVYVLVFVAGMIGLTASGLGSVSAIGGVAATLNGVGPGLGDLGGVENFTALSDGGRIVAIALMLAGRLELFSVVALLVALAGLARRR